MSTPIEVTTQHATSVQGLPAAWAFVMDRLDQLDGPPEEITMRRVHSLTPDDPDAPPTYEVAVTGMREEP